METKKWISPLFWIAAAYDGILGIAFLLFPVWLFTYFEVTPPNHFAYVQFPACLLIVFAIMFVAVAIAPVRNRNLVPYGILLKVSYCSMAFFYWFSQDVPNMWKPFAVCDLAFLALFYIAYTQIPKRDA